jgi:hypothetical protein
MHWLLGRSTLSIKRKFLPIQTSTQTHPEPIKFSCGGHESKRNSVGSNKDYKSITTTERQISTYYKQHKGRQLHHINNILIHDNSHKPIQSQTITTQHDQQRQTVPYLI